MEDGIAIKGTYADFKTVKSRSVVQMVIEIPIEQSTELVSKFGIPIPSEEVWVAVARLQTNPVRVLTNPEKNLVQNVVLLCRDNEFGFFLKTKGMDLDPNDAESVGNALKRYLEIQSRKEIATNSKVRKLWYALYEEYWHKKC